MGYPRALLVDPDHPGYYHCVSRCVQRAFLCGNGHDHRRQWIEDRLAELLDIFAVEACGYAIMANHLHLVLKVDPQAPRRWSDRQIARRLARLFPAKLQKLRAAARTPAEADRLQQQYLESLAADRRRMALWRQRLGSLSWFNKLLKEPIARRANRENGCTGHFWEGRFKSIRLLDEAAVLGCMVYVDLNPRRAGLARRLADSVFTSILQRLKVIRGQGGPGRGRRRRGRRGGGGRLKVPLIPVQRLFSMSTAQYVQLVETTGSPDQPPPQSQQELLVGLGIELVRWGQLLGRRVPWFGTAVGSPVKLLAEAQRRGARRVINPLRIYAT